MKTAAIFILATIAVAPAFARPISSFELEQSHITGEQQHEWGNLISDVVNFHRKPVLSVRNVANELYARDFDDELEARYFDDELEARDFDDEFEARDFDDELEARDFDEELEARDFDEGLEARDFGDGLEARDFNEELEARDHNEALERRGHHCPECKKPPTNRCIKKGHLEECDKHDTPVYSIPGNECATCKEVRLAAEREAKKKAKKT